MSEKIEQAATKLLEWSQVAPGTFVAIMVILLLWFHWRYIVCPCIKLGSTLYGQKQLDKQNENEISRPNKDVDPKSTSQPGD